MKIMITGAGGFIGGHLAQRLFNEGHEVIGVDIKYHDYFLWNTYTSKFVIADLRDPERVDAIMGHNRPEWLFMLAADMGGMGFISQNHAKILHNNSLINTNTIHAAAQWPSVRRIFLASSVCVYPSSVMDGEFDSNITENLAYPANPADAYGWEKLTAEKMLLHYMEDYKIDGRIGRFMNTYGPYGTWEGGREKAPAAFCRKVAESQLRGDNPIQVDCWGDGKQVRSFTYIDDLVEGIIRLMGSDYQFPVNLGCNNEFVTMDEMIKIVWEVAALSNNGITIRHILKGPEGARVRRESNTLAKHILGWKPYTTLGMGISKTYPWIEKQVKNRYDESNRATI